MSYEGCFQISPCLNRLWPPEGDKRVTNMDVVFFGDLENVRTAPAHGMPGETWVQKGHPKECWPEQWLSKDLGSNVRIFEIRPLCDYGWPKDVPDQRFEEAAMQKLYSVALDGLFALGMAFGKKDKDGQGCPLVFVAHGYGGLVVKHILTYQSAYSLSIQPDVRSNLCGVVFYGAVPHFYVPLNNKKVTKLWKTFKTFKAYLKHPKVLLKLSQDFENAVDLNKIRVCVVNEGNSNMQEIKKFADFEHEYTSIIGSSEICKPTSKEDPMYQMLLKFLQQCHIVGTNQEEDLHQMVDDMKDRKGELSYKYGASHNSVAYVIRTSELSFLEGNSTQKKGKTRNQESVNFFMRLHDKNREKEISQASQLVQGGVDNIDQVAHVVVTEDEEVGKANLQKFFQNKLFSVQRNNEGASTNLHQLTKDDILVGCRQGLKGIEFLFTDKECMSKVVGVGLDRAMVLVTSEYDVEVIPISEDALQRSWEKVFMQVKDSASLALVAIKMPRMNEDKISTVSLPAAEISRKFGVSLKDFHGVHVITVHSQEKQSDEFFPLIWKVADEYRQLLKHRSPTANTKETSETGSTTPPNTSASRSVQRPTGGTGERGQDFSENPNSNWKREGNENADGNKPPDADPPPDPPSGSLHTNKSSKLKVSIFPDPGGTFHPISGGQRSVYQPESRIKSAAIMPIIELEFVREGMGNKFITVTTTTHCSLGEGGPKDDDKYVFGWYQDNIEISFKEGDQLVCTRPVSSYVCDQSDNPGESTKRSVNNTLLACTSSSQQQSLSVGSQAHIAGFGFQGEIDMNKIQTTGKSFSTANTQEIPSVKQIEGFNVHRRSAPNNMIFKFCIPFNVQRYILDCNELQHLSRYGNTFVPKIIGKWIVLTGNESSPYIFNVKRDLFNIQQYKEKRIMQDYQLLMYINLAMTHLDRFIKKENILVGQELELPNVVKVLPVW